MPASLPFVVIGYDDFSGHDFRLQLICSMTDDLSQDLRVKLIARIIHALVREAEVFDSTHELAGLSFLDRRINRLVHTLQHAGENEPRLGPVLVGIAADGEFLFLLGGIEYAKPRSTSGRKDHVRPLAVLRYAQLFALGRIVPRFAGDA